MDGIPTFEDTINWDPFSDSMFFCGMDESALSDSLYELLEEQEMKLLRELQ